MTARRDRLERLLAIRSLSEDRDRKSLELALASVAEVEAGLARQDAALADSGLAARAALSSGDRAEWLMADAQAEVTGWNRRRLRALLQTRALEVAPAMEKFLNSRREHRQVKQLLDNAQRAATLEGDRRNQAAADDWFLGKLTRPVE
jgi:hypothetical protein